MLRLLKKFQNVQSLEDFEALIDDDEARIFLPFESTYYSTELWNVINFILSIQFDKKYLPAEDCYSSDFYEKMLI